MAVCLSVPKSKQALYVRRIVVTSAISALAFTHHVEVLRWASCWFLGHICGLELSHPVSYPEPTVCQDQHPTREQSSDCYGFQLLRQTCNPIPPQLDLGSLSELEVHKWNLCTLFSRQQQPYQAECMEPWPRKIDTTWFHLYGVYGRRIQAQQGVIWGRYWRSGKTLVTVTSFQL